MRGQRQALALQQAQRVREITGREVREWKPAPENGKDLASINARQVQIVQEADRERQREIKQQTNDGPNFHR